MVDAEEEYFPEEISKLKRERSTLLEKIERLEQDVRTKSETIEELNDKLKNLERTIASLQGKVNSQQRTIDDCGLLPEPALAASGCLLFEGLSMSLDWAAFLC